MTLNLSAAELWSGTAQTTGANGRLVSAGAPAAGIVSANAAGTKVIIEPMNALAANGNSGTPVAEFSATPLTGSAPFEVQFFDQSSGGLYEILSWTWDFGDGSPYGSSQDPNHLYENPGTYSVSLTIMTTGGFAYTTRDSYITVMQGVSTASWATLLILAMTFVSAGGVLVRKQCPGRQTAGHL